MIVVIVMCQMHRILCLSNISRYYINCTIINHLLFKFYIYIHPYICSPIQISSLYAPRSKLFVYYTNLNLWTIVKGLRDVSSLRFFGSVCFCFEIMKEEYDWLVVKLLANCYAIYYFTLVVLLNNEELK